MADAYCEPCKQEGRGLIVAHYKGVPASMSHTGKAIPSMCWHHRNNKPLPAISAPPRGEEAPAPKRAETPTPDVLEPPAPTTSKSHPRKDFMNSNDKKSEQRVCACGCGTPIWGRWPYIKGHGQNPPRETGGRKSAKKTRAASRVSPPRKNAATPSPKPTGVAMICVSESHLDSFWAKLSLEEKAQIFERQLEGA